jgi:hypothetical protein
LISAVALRFVYSTTLAAIALVYPGVWRAIPAARLLSVLVPIVAVEVLTRFEVLTTDAAIEIRNVPVGHCELLLES